MFSRILVATDGSDDAIRAAEFAAELAERFGASVTILTVYSPIVYAAGGPTAYEVDPLVITEIQDAVIDRTAVPFQLRNVAFDRRTEVGNPAATIVGVAESEGDDLIVMGSHGVGGVRRFLLGSVSDRVGHYAHCAVMIIKPEVGK
jgi:nucleotide-binding universal stress UspA family protein